jgi:hypothetical protein
MPKKAGRPKAETGKLRIVVTERLSPDEKRLLDAAATKAGQRPATWRRNVLLAAAGSVKSNT